MSHNIALILALAVPAVVMVVLRVNAALVFLSLCLGQVLVQYVAPQANDLIGLATPHANEFSQSTIQLALLGAPAAVTIVVTILSMHGHVKPMLNILPAVAASALAVLLTVPLLPPGLRYALQDQQAWHYLSKSDALVVSAGAVVSLVFLWSQRSLFRHRDKRRHY